MALDLFNAIIILDNTYQKDIIKEIVLLRLAILRPNIFSNWCIKLCKEEHYLDWADLGQLLIIVSYNWLKTI